jgi:hypothetical protein
MTAIHPLHRFYVGDTWVIQGTLLDADGKALDLGGCSLQWGLVDRNRAVALDDSKAQVFIVNAVLGQIKIVVNPAQTSQVLPGTYYDSLRVTGATLVATVWVGPITVEASPFAHAVGYGSSVAQEEADVALMIGNVA